MRAVTSQKREKDRCPDLKEEIETREAEVETSKLDKVGKAIDLSRPM